MLTRSPGRLFAIAAALTLAVQAASADTLSLSQLPFANQPGSNAKVDGTNVILTSPSKIVITLNRTADHLKGKVSINEDVANGASILSITGDDRRLLPASNAQPAGGRGGRGGMQVTTAAGSQDIDVDVSGVRVLVIETTGPAAFGRGGRGGRGAAAGAQGGAATAPALVAAALKFTDASINYNGTKPDVPALPKEEALVLTPKTADTPRINGAKVFGVRPGKPFMFTVPATGQRPIQFTAENLPAGLTLDATTGIITGRAPGAMGDTVVKLHAKNALGTADSTLKIVVGDTIQLTPALGWNSWNCFGPAVTGENIKAAADAMYNSGLVNHGWTYINIDDYWEYNARLAQQGDPTMQGVTPRQPDGSISTNKRFPDMKALTDYIHAKGMKAGIYSGPGPTTCGGCTASWEHEEQDAKSIADWGFDYLKYDWCSYDSVIGGRPQMSDIPTLKKPYDVMTAALKKQDRDIVHSLCQYGWGEVWKWGESSGGNSWRTTGDITDTWASLTGIWDTQWERLGPGGAMVPTEMWKASKPGHFNDADMMIIGMVSVASGRNFHPTNLTPNEQYTHVSAWILMNCPMLIGCDMTKFDDFTLSLLANDEVLAVNQDPKAEAAQRLISRRDAGGFEIWAKTMEDGSKAVGIFNRSELEGSYALKLSDLGISGKQTVRDLWRQKDVATADSTFETTVPRHGVVLVKISPAK